MDSNKTTRRRRNAVLIITAIGLEIATLALASSYRFAADEVRDTLELVAGMHALSAAEWEAIATLKAGEADMDEVIEAASTVRSMSSHLAERGTVTLETQGDLQDFLAAVQLEMEYLQSGKLAEALTVDETVVDPLFDELTEELKVAVQAANRRASRANMVATVGLIVAVAGGVAISGLFVRRLERARQAEETVQSKDKFIATVSHELRTPLTAIGGFAEVLSDGDHLDADEKTEMIRVIVEQTREMGYLIEDLLVGARSEVGTLSIRLDDVDLHTVTLKTVAGIALADGKTIDIDIPNGSTVIADPGRLKQVIRNLVTNANHYGGAHITVSASTTGSRIWLEVSDDGAGIDPSDRDRVFDAYAQAAHRHTAGSVGIGLFISKQLVELMNANISYHHTSDGPTFRIDLPTAQARVNSPSALV